VTRSMTHKSYPPHHTLAQYLRHERTHAASRPMASTRVPDGPVSLLTVRAYGEFSGTPSADRRVAGPSTGLGALMSATLSVTREGVGVELRRGVFDISVDGKSVGSINRHDTVEAPVEPGTHTVQITAGRYTSRPQSFRVADGDTLNFQCHGAMVWPRYVASVVKPDLAISLKRQ
jgi:hypothetical protein